LDDDGRSPEKRDKNNYYLIEDWDTFKPYESENDSYDDAEYCAHSNKTQGDRQ
jgi:hypothetical protein